MSRESNAGQKAAVMLLGVNGIGLFCIIMYQLGIQPNMAANVSKYTLSLFMILAGLAHFDSTMMPFYLSIMPPILPFQEELIYLSGVFEIASGILSLISATKRVGAWLTIATLLGVFPANIYMALSEEAQAKMGAAQGQSNARLLLQFIMIYMAYIYAGKSDNKNKAS